MTDIETERVTMVWPKELKDQVREKAGKRGITEFTTDAVSIHLGVAEDLGASSKELGETRHFAQQLADQLVLSGDKDDRLQRLMELEFPSWIDTTGWPKAYAERVHPVPDPEPEPVVDPEPEAPLALIPYELGNYQSVGIVRDVPDLSPPPVEAPTAPVDPGLSTDEFFARIMAQTGGKLSDVPGLKVASQVERPKVKKLESEEAGFTVSAAPTCPACGEELVDGECWTCG